MRNNNQEPGVAQVLRTPNRWGHLTLVSTYRAPVMSKNKLTGEEYEMDSHGPAMMRLRCDCGHEFEISFKEFPGRRKLRWCGRAECPHNPARKRAKQPKEPAGTYSLYLPHRCVQQVREWAAANNRPLGRAFAEILDAGLIHKLLE